MKQLAAFLLLLGALRHLVWPLFPPAQQAQVWNLVGAVSIAALLCLVWRQNRGPLVGAVALWFLWEEALVATCSSWRLFENWIVPIGEGQCLAKTGPQVVSVSLIALGVIIERLNHER